MIFRSLLILSLLLQVMHYCYSQKEKQAITLSAYADIYYLYNFNKPLNNSQPPFIYNFKRNNEVNLNLGFIKANYNTEKARANIALMTGTYTQANLAVEPEVLRHIYEANIGVRLSKKSNIWLDAGIMPSHIGFESAISKDCPNITRSLLAENSPYYEAGLKVSYTTTDEKWFLSALLLNGWQRIRRPDGNTTPAFGTQLTYKPSQKVNLNSSTFIGNDKPDSVRQWRYFHNFYGTYQLSEKFALITGFDAGLEQKSKAGSQMNVWYSPVLIAKYSVTDKAALAARAEYYSDKQGVIIVTSTPNGFQTFGYSLNFDYAIQQNVLWRVEARTLNSKDNIFEKENSTFTSNSTFLVTSIAVSF